MCESMPLAMVTRPALLLLLYRLPPSKLLKPLKRSGLCFPKGRPYCSISTDKKELMRHKQELCNMGGEALALRDMGQC